MVIGFWNINNNTDIAELLVDFVKENGVDILLLAEAEIDPKKKFKTQDILLEFIKKTKKQKFLSNFSIIPNADYRIKILSVFPPSQIKLKSNLFKSSRWSAYCIEIPSIIKFNLFPVHFYSKVNWSEFSLALECVNFSRDIKLVESDTNCENSILIGDFNMNPFEYGMVASNGINAIQDLSYAEKNKREGKLMGCFTNTFITQCGIF